MIIENNLNSYSFTILASNRNNHTMLLPQLCNDLAQDYKIKRNLDFSQDMDLLAV